MNISDIPGIQNKINSIQDAELQKVATEAANLALTQAVTYVEKQSQLLETLASQRSKIEDNTATDKEKQEYYKNKEELQRINDLLNASGKLAEAEVKQIKQQQLQKKLNTLKGAQGRLTFSKAGDLYEYVLRTQALNPYSRERACDIEFLDNLLVISQNTEEEIKKIKALQALIKEVF